MLLPPTGAPFMYKIKENEMIVISLGYKSYIMNNKDAVVIADILERAEMYETVWIPSGERNGGPDHTYHVYESTDQIDMKLISADLYNMAKLAGKPEKK